MTLIRRLASSLESRLVRENPTEWVRRETGIKLAQPALPSDFMKTKIDARDRSGDRARIGGTYLHVSSLMNMCVRQEVLARRSESAVYRQVTGGHRLMWGIGKSVERHIRENFIEAHGPGQCYGDWTCACKHTSHIGTFNPEHTCRRCGQKLTTYREATLQDQEHLLSGNPDLLWYMADWMVITEIKSMNKGQWDELQQPLGDHIHQAVLYHYLARANGFKVHDHIAILYGVKDFVFKSPYKEFHLDVANQAAYQSLVEMSLEAARERKNALANGVTPRRICTSQDSRTAKQCPLAHLCFSME